MQFGLGVLRLSPSQFWAMTPKELDAAFRANNILLGFIPPIERNRLDQLMADFPDKETKK